MTIILFLRLIAVIPCLRNRILKIIKDAMSAFIFNGLINSLNISYLTVCITAIAQIITIAKTNEDDSSTMY